ncbi:response regulator transcription factor [Saccharomonospora glauca]|uniref:Response regulator containing a CheY-like receiver domain and an HTH DNA-binding domain n=1 Tax=Saccharomonospora glauca K62 TaxID=928724 RepID=I1D834_9PSEU|nr:response regulator transcription factor [Saccharomonospora glauca]EIF01109.1 response regulator containing a CheY-like receiver domain and an HTH DNA-binding domain [Saccharomonospora glauca K62]
MAHGTHAARGAYGLNRATRTLTVAAVDSVPIFRDGLSAVISRTPGLRWGGHAGNHHAGIQMCEQLRPDVLLIDSALDPHGHLSRLLAEGHPMLVIMILVDPAHRTSAYLDMIMSTGVHGALPRSVEPRQLTEGIRRAYVERHYTDPALAPLVPTQRSGEAGAARRPHMPLSRREYQVLQLIAEGMENSAVADTLFLSVETVRTHVKSILRKLSARDRTHAVTKAFRSGLLVVTPENGGRPDERTPSRP